MMEGTNFCTCVHVCVYGCTHAHTHVHTDVHACTHTYMYAYMHYMCIKLAKSPKCPQLAKSTFMAHMALI